MDDFLSGISTSPGSDGFVHVNFSKKDLELNRKVLSTFLWIVQLLTLPKVGVGILRKILNIFPSKSDDGRPSRNNDQTLAPVSGSDETDGKIDNESDKEEKKDHEKDQEFLPNPSNEPKKPRSNPNHPGRRTGEDLEEAIVIEHYHSSLQHGASCPSHDCRGRVYIFLKEGKVREVITFDFSPPFIPTIHLMRDLRCNLCFKVFKASLSQNLIKDGALTARYLYPAQAALVVLHYGMGMPFFRLDQFQSLTGERFPESTQFDIVEKVANAFRCLIIAATKEGANGFLFMGDDVGNRVLELVPELRERRSDGQLTYREGVHTSLLISITPEGNLIPVLKTGINHFGEHLDDILLQRSDNLPIPQIVCDGSKVNQTGPSFPMLPIMGGCWQHAQEYFFKAMKNFPMETKEIMAHFKKIFEIDRDTHLLSAEDRLNHLKEFGLPFVEKIKNAVDDFLNSRKILPKSELGQALGYFHSQYNRLLLPFTCPGVPLTNNLSEWCTYLVVRYLANSKFYKSKAGAAIGDTLMMILLMSYLSHLNPYEYILHCLRHQKEMKENPKSFLPWNLKGVVETLPSHKQLHFWAPAPPLPSKRDQGS